MNPQHKERVAKTLRFSLLDGVFASGMLGFTQDYFIPFLLLLGGTARHVSFMSSLPNFFSALVQLLSPDLTEKVGSRRKIINLFVLVQAAVLIPMATTAFGNGCPPEIFIILVTLFTGCGAFVSPAWGSLMSDLVEHDKRGEYFGLRNRLLGFILVGMTLTAGLILFTMKKVNAFYGFAIIFGAACLFRIISWYFLTRMHEPPIEYKKENHFTIIKFLSRTKESNFARFVLFVATFNFSVNMASPFFAVLMLRDLHLNYLVYTLLNITVTITVYLMMGRWGRLADQVGNLAVIRFTAPIIATLPLMWVIHRDTPFLFAYQIISGFAWAGFNLCASNFIIDAVIPEKRTRCIAYFNVLNGLALCLGALVGGLLLPRLPALFGNHLFALFLVSSALRLTVSLSVPRRLKEVRAVPKTSAHRLFLRIIGIEPLVAADKKLV